MPKREWVTGTYTREMQLARREYLRSRAKSVPETLFAETEAADLSYVSGTLTISARHGAPA
jgi:hypothetical protein